MEETYQKKLKIALGRTLDKSVIRIAEGNFKNTEESFDLFKIKTDLLKLDTGAFCFWIHLDELKKIERQMNRNLKEMIFWLDATDTLVLKDFLNKQTPEKKQTEQKTLE